MTPEKPKEIKQPNAEAAIEELWRKGNLDFLLDSNQRELKRLHKNTKSKIITALCCRGMGKSYWLVVMAIEECLKNPKALVKYACPTQTMAREIIQPLIRDITETCPQDIKPEYKTNESAYRFPSGAVIQLSGLDNGKSERLRGGSSTLCIVDEAGMVKGSSKSKGNLAYIIKSILIPAVTRNKKINGKILLASTPPESADHPFVTYVRRAEIEKSLFIRNVYQCPRYTKEMIEELKYNLGGENSTDFRREYLSEIITSADSAVVPEFTMDLQSRIVKELPRPPFFHNYVAMDIGVRDLTAVLFAYYDFKLNKVIIEDEVIMGGKDFNTQKLADAIKSKEMEIWTDKLTGELKEPFKRVSDNNLIVINDMYQLHGLLFEPTRKDDADAALNNMRIMLSAEKILINPKCINLIRHLRDATWDKNKKSYSRSADNGHYDCVDSLSYLIRNIEFNINPYPPGYGLGNIGNTWNYKKPQSNHAWAIKQMLNIKK